MPSVTTHAVPTAVANAMAQITGQVSNRRVKTHKRWGSCGRIRCAVPRIANPAGRSSGSRAYCLPRRRVERTARCALGRTPLHPHIYWLLRREETVSHTIRVTTKPDLFERRKQEHLQAGYRIEHEQPVAVNGLCSFIAVRIVTEDEARG